MPNVSSSLDTIVSEAIEIADDAQRSKYVTDACGDDAPLRERAEALIGAHFRAGRFLTGTTTPADRDFGDQSDDAIGPYRLLEQIGEGGMGIVYVAEQTEPVRRRVALKVIKPGMDSKEVVARFEAERQALALMDHPNIAKVFDGGATSTGRPYFVMELVRGLPITEYCDQAKLSPERRLRLYVQVCRAVQHAHQKGIIHRDLKPSNVLITLHDGEPVPKVIDFGVAKAIGQRLTEHSAYTRLTQMIGTPLYMSPEQAELSALDVDTRSDVYSLGVLLYELLTGTTPFDAETLRQAGFDEMRRIIREDEPPRPSARISTLDAAARSTVSSKRGLDERQLSRLLHGDIDWIVMKALEKDRNRRYESAGAFAADIERYLSHEPVAARPPSMTYRMRKFVRRNRGTVIAAAVSMAAVLLVTWSLFWFSQNRAARRIVANREGSAALAEADQFWSERRWDQSLACALRANAALAIAEADPELRSQAQSAIKDLKMVVALDDARLQSAVGIWRTTDNKEMFNIQAKDEGYETAFRGYGVDVFSISPDAVAEKVRPSRIREELVHALYDWASFRMKLGLPNGTYLLAAAQAADTDGSWSLRLSEAHAAGDREAIEAMARSIPLDDQPPMFLLRLANELSDLGGSDAAIEFLRNVQRRYAGDYWVNHELAQMLAKSKPPRAQEAIEFYRAALALRPRSAGTNVNLGSSLMTAKRLNEATDAFREAIRLQPDYAQAHYSLGRSAHRAGRTNEAIVKFRESARLAPGNAVIQDLVGGALSDLGDHVAGASYCREAIRLRPDNAGYRSDLGVALMRQGDLDAAITCYREALRLNPDEPMVHSNLAIALRRSWRLEESIAEHRARVKADPTDWVGHYDLGKSLNDAGRFVEAEAAYREAIRLRPEDAETLCNLGRNLAAQGRIEEGLVLLRKGHEIGMKEQNWKYNSAQWVADCERLAKMGPRLALVINEEAKPADAKEASDVLTYSYNKHSFAITARLYASFCRTVWEKHGNADTHRFLAGFASARAGCGQGDGAQLDAEARASLRRQALAELRKVLNKVALLISKGNVKEIAFVRQWLVCDDLACVREPVFLAALPESERAEWEQFWKDVRKLCAESDRTTPK